MKKLFQIILAVAIVGLVYVIYVQISTPIRFDMERHFLAGCTLVVESACTHDAVHRILRNLYEAVCSDDTSFCQYAGGTHGNAGADLFDIHIGEYGTCFERDINGGFGAV